VKAIVCHRYGDADAIELVDVDQPSPGPGEVLIRVRAASLNALDWHMLKGRPAFFRLFLGLPRPRTRPGRDVAGRVESIGTGVTRFKTGDDVFGVCRGSLAEYACAAESIVVAKHPAVSCEDAAAVPIAALTAMQALRDHGRLRAGQRVLINGASGGVGTFAVQYARVLGAEVSGVCSARNVELVRSIGAGRVFDYTREDFTRSGERYDVVFDLVANHPISECRRVLNPGGIIVIAGAGGSDGRGMMRKLVRTMIDVPIWKLRGQKVSVFVARVQLDDLTAMGELIAAGKVRPVIDGRYRLSEAAQAMRHLAEGHARGKIVVTVEPGTT
jgi:NADPH:quinone reductase-like Zn-dependent oxidoreductase